MCSEAVLCFHTFPEAVEPFPLRRSSVEVVNLRDMSVDADIAFSYKQWGGYAPKAGGRTLDGREWTGSPASTLTTAESA